MSEKMPARVKIALLLILIAGVFTRANHLGEKVLWIDEGINWRVASFKTVAQIIHYNSFEEHSPFPQILSHFWVKTFGDSITALHAQPLMFSIAALLVFTYFMFRFFSVEVAFGAVTALSLSAFVPEFAQMDRYPSLGMFVASLWWLGLLGYWKSGKLPSVALYGIALAIAAHTHLYSIFTIFALIIFQIAARKSFGRSVAPLLAANAFALASIAPKYFLMQNNGITALAKQIPFNDALAHLLTFPVGSIVRILLAFCINRSNELEAVTIPAAAIILAVFGAVAFSSFFHKRYKLEARLCFSLLVIPMLIGWLAMIFKGTYFQSQYYFPPFLPFCIMLGIGADRLRQWKPVMAPLLFTLYCILSFHYLNIYWSRINRPENIKTLLEHTAASERPGDFLTISPPYTFSFDYYWKGRIPVYDFSSDYNPVTTPHNNIFLIEADRNQLTNARMEKWHRDVASRYKRLWMFWIQGERNTEDKTEVAKHWLDSHYRTIETRRYRMFPYMDDYTGVMVLYEVRKSH